MKVIETKIADVLILEPDVYGDERGFFFESFNEKLFNELTGLNYQFVQDNHSMSKKGVLRGLHYQLPPKAQGKLIRVITGEAFDVAIDLRQSSSTFGNWVGEVLSADNKKQVWIPEGFAHGFIALSESVELLYKTTDFYASELQQCIRWDDPDLNIAWPEGLEPLLSPRDLQGCSFKDTPLFD